VVVETALRTASGQMQYDAKAILTGIPQTQVAYASMATEAALNGTLPQYSLPVAVNTPLASGDVFHTVQYGQSLWSIAINYNTTIKQIQALNNLPDTTIYTGQKLLVMKHATQLAPAATQPAAPLVARTPQPEIIPLFVAPTRTPTSASPVKLDLNLDRDSALPLAMIGLAGLVLVAVLIVGAKKR